MTFAKLMIHAVLAGIYGGLVVTLLLVLGNPGAASRGAGAGPGLLIVVLLYALAAGLVWPLLYAVVRFFASHPLRLPWLSLRYLVGFHAVNTAVILAAGWIMLSGHRAALDPRDADRLANACLGLSLAWLAGAVITVVPRLRRRALAPAVAGGAALAALLVAASGGTPSPATGTLVTGALSPLRGGAPGGVPAPGGDRPIARAPGETRPQGTGTSASSYRRAPAARRLLLLNFDGADLDTILTMHAQGKLPAFSRFIQEGAGGRLLSVRPCAAAVTRTSLVTGMLPYRHGVRATEAVSVLGRDPWLEVTPPGIGFHLLLSPLLARRALGVADRSTPALWEIGTRMGWTAESAGWDVDLDAAGPAAVRAGPDWVADLLDPEASRPQDSAARALMAEIVRAAAADEEVFGALRRAVERPGQGIAAFSFPGLDRVAHIFLRYARPADFGNVTGREVDLYGPVLERYYGKMDAIVGSALQPGPGETLVLVTSTHGIEPMTLGRRFLKELTGGGPRSGVHDRGPGGFLLALGPNIRRGHLFGKGSLADVAPSALYALGLPVARDSDGAILTTLFSEDFTASHPVTVVGSYGEAR
ncbi:MAG: alkaline phosphatase family protein [Acidobacteria bacterium]|nr:alkaline phosphatase family protein [Acidobacteriota bacterium]